MIPLIIAGHMKLKTARKRLKLTQIELAEKTKGAVDQSTISRLERGGARPSGLTLLALAKALKVPAETLEF